MTKAHNERTFVMKLLLVFVALLTSCTLQIETPKEDIMGYPNPDDIERWAPPPQGGFDPARNYNIPSSQSKEAGLKAWQQNVKLVSSNAAVGPVKALMTTQFPDPGIYTAQFSIASPSQTPGGPPPAKATDSLRCQAILSWVVEGNQIQRIFDIGNGTTISGAGSGAIIQVQDLTSTLVGASGTNGVEYQVSVSVSKGTRAQFQTPVIQPGSGFIAPATSSTDVGTIAVAPGLIAIFKVPVNSGAISAKVSLFDTTAPATRPVFVVATMVNGVALLYRWVPDIDPSFIPLVPGATSVQVANTSGTDTVHVSLDWGIDG